MLYPSDGIGDPVGERYKALSLEVCPGNPVGERYKALSLEVCPIELANDPS